MGMDNDCKKMTTLKWHKLGRVFKAEGQTEWMVSHTAMPQALVFNDYVRIFFGTRNVLNRSHIGFIDIDPENPSEILNFSKSPVLSPGPWGCFDDNGLYPGNFVQEGNRILMYYMGRNNGTPPLYYMAIGLAESLDGGQSFNRVSPAPVLGRTAYDPWMTSTPWVIKEEKNSWQMWYLSGEGWQSLEDQVSRYFIRSASSIDGIDWKPRGDVVIPLKEDETNVAAPTVWEEQGLWHMIYCYVKSSIKTYSLGYAISEDRVNWSRHDSDIGITLSPEGWDSEAMAYPSVFAYKGSRYLLYSGNALGREGIGLAKLEGYLIKHAGKRYSDH